MFPRSSCCGVIYDAGTDIEANSYDGGRLAARKALPNYRNVFLFQLSGGALTSARKTPSPLRQHISDVVGIRPDEEMIWVAAGRNVTAVKNMAGPWSTKMDPGSLVGATVSIQPEAPISVFVGPSTPQPAAAVRVVLDFIKKALKRALIHQKLPKAFVWLEGGRCRARLPSFTYTPISLNVA